LHFSPVAGRALFLPDPLHHLCSPPFIIISFDRESSGSPCPGETPVAIFNAQNSTENRFIVDPFVKQIIQ
jgi:hypothetical protein